VCASGTSNSRDGRPKGEGDESKQNPLIKLRTGPAGQPYYYPPTWGRRRLCSPRTEVFLGVGFGQADPRRSSDTGRKVHRQWTKLLGEPGTDVVGERNLKEVLNRKSGDTSRLRKRERGTGEQRQKAIQKKAKGGLPVIRVRSTVAGGGSFGGRFLLP